ncbi:hypothetical protein [Ascidiimonas sp. W6]|uniref:hypothetical protein n=1 Tax=Ascidiimonas meishanensis TaxID=3128903 RepID=UPI0030EB9E4D
MKKLFYIACFAMVVFACSKDDNDQALIDQTSERPEAIFQEVYFGSTETPTLSHARDMAAMRETLNEEQLAQLADLEGVIMENIKELEPGFFDRFNASMQSGDQNEISAALKEGGEVFERALLATPEIAEEVMLGKELAAKINIDEFVTEEGVLDQDKLHKYVEQNFAEEVALISPTFIFAAVYVVAAVSVAVAVNYAGAVNVWIWFNAFKWVNGPSKSVQPTPVDSELQYEMLVNEIATNFSRQ